MIAAMAHSLTPFFMVYKQEALIPAKPMAIDVITHQYWDCICKDKWAYTEELVAMFAG